MLPMLHSFMKLSSLPTIRQVNASSGYLKYVTDALSRSYALGEGLINISISRCRFHKAVVFKLTLVPRRNLLGELPEQASNV